MKPGISHHLRIVQRLPATDFRPESSCLPSAGTSDTDCRTATSKSSWSNAASMGLAIHCLLIDAARPSRRPVGASWFVDET